VLHGVSIISSAAQQHNLECAVSLPSDTYGAVMFENLGVINILPNLCTEVIVMSLN